MVFFHHYNPVTEEKYGWYLHSLVDEMHIGVDVFFVLSSYLITKRYGAIATHSITFWKTYIVNRIARIYPVFLLLTSLTFIDISLQNHSYNWGVYLSNITLAKGLFNDLKFTLIPQTWTLTVEECFYLFAPFAYISLRKNRFSYLIVSVLAIGIILHLCNNWFELYGLMENWEFVGSYTFWGRIPQFVLGMLVAKVNFKVFTNKTLVGSTLLLICLLSFPIIQNSYGVEFALFTDAGYIVTMLPFSLGIALLIDGLARESSLLSKVLGLQLVELSGKASYCFYLIHLGFVATFFQKYTSNFWMLFGLIWLSSIVLHLLFEEPIRNKLRIRHPE